MIDASSKSFEENIAITKQVVEYAHDHGVVVEAELGSLAGIEDEVNVSAEAASYTRPEEVGRVLRIPRVITRAVAAAVVFLVYIAFLDKDVTEGSGATLPAATPPPQENMLDDTEEDTFDNPEDAIRCFRNAYGNVMLAINTAQDNTKEIESRLEEAFTPYK